MPKIEVTWNEVSEEGEKQQYCARTEGQRWVFLTRAKRFDDWIPVDEPSLELWLKVLDGVRRRATRRRASDRDEARLVAHLRQLFPGADLG